GVGFAAVLEALAVEIPAAQAIGAAGHPAPQTFERRAHDERILIPGLPNSPDPPPARAAGSLPRQRKHRMKRITRICVGLLRDERGTETLEWGLVCGLIVVGAITAIALIGPKVQDMWNDVNNEIQVPAR